MLLHVEHEQYAESDHRERPQPRERYLPASGKLRQSLENADSESCESEIEVLGLDASHHRHVLGAMHPGVMLVKKKHDRPTDGENREHPPSPGRFQNAAGALKLKKAESEENYGKRLVLHIFEIVGETVRPTLGSEGPEFRVAENQQKQAGEQETKRPCEAK